MHRLFHQRLQLLDQRRDRAMKTQRWPRRKRDFAKSVVFLKNIDRAELVDVDTWLGGKGSQQQFWFEINIEGSNQRANPAAVMALFDLAPPAFELVLDHRRLFNED